MEIFRSGPQSKEHTLHGLPTGVVTKKLSARELRAIVSPTTLLGTVISNVNLKPKFKGDVQVQNNFTLVFRQDINNGECGGVTFYSVYEVTNVTLSYASFGGFCLTCRMQHRSIVLSSMECDAKANGYCERNCTESLPVICEQHTVNADVYSTEKIESSKSTTPTILSLDYSPITERSTSTSKPAHFHVTSMKTSSSISRSSHIDPTPSTKLEGTSPTTIAGAGIAGIVAVISVVFLVFYFIKRRKLQCLQSEQQQAKRPNMFDNSTYDDLTVTNQRHNDTDTNMTPEYDNQESIGKIDDIYVEKEEEYDHLHSSRQKHLTKETKGNEYGTACYLEDSSYSTLGQSRNPEPDLDNGYSTMPSLENNGSSVGNSEYDFCYQMNQRKDW